MVAFDPQYRNETDTKEFGNRRFLASDEIADVAEYVLKSAARMRTPRRRPRKDALLEGQRQLL